LFRLNDFKLTAKKDWPLNLQVSYSWEMNLKRLIEVKTDRRKGSKVTPKWSCCRKKNVAAKEYDLLKGEQSMYQFLEQLKSHDTSTRKRKRT
jgi:hypothetical protein